VTEADVGAEANPADIGQALRVSLLGKGLTDWTGGNDYLRLCLTSLITASPSTRINLLVPQPTATRRLRSCAGTVKRATGQFLRHGKIVSLNNSRNSVQDVRDAIRGDIVNLDAVGYLDCRGGLLRALRTSQSEVAFPSLQTLGPDFPVPWVGYIPDFQHRHLPQFFSKREIELRDRLFGTLVRDAKALSVNSRAVGEDVRRFYPSWKGQLFVLPFAPIPGPNWLDIEAESVLESYSLPRRYFLISNQFWIHKSHATAFEALSLLHSKSGFDDVKVICTGATQDYRWPQYFHELKQSIERMGISSRIRFLGKIPKLDQIAIMKRAVAVVQPTLFEGGPGGGSVYDAVAIGTRVIASDIPVNLEINHPTVRFFTAGSSKALSEALQEALETPYQRPNVSQLEKQARLSKMAFGNGILAAVRYVMSQSAFNAGQESSAEPGCAA
jgi:glycosyltransferase involved in cell wall biosynthesis